MSIKNAVIVRPIGESKLQRGEDARLVASGVRGGPMHGVVWQWRKDIEIVYPSGSPDVIPRAQPALVWNGSIMASTVPTFDLSRGNRWKTFTIQGSGIEFIAHEKDIPGIAAANDIYPLIYHHPNGWRLVDPAIVTVVSVVHIAWILNGLSSTVISVFNNNGTPAAVPQVTFPFANNANNSDPHALNVAGSAIWVGHATSPPSALILFYDGSFAGLPIVTSSAAGSPFQYGFTTVADEVWASIDTGGVTRFLYDGGSAGSNVTPTDDSVAGGTVVGSQVWLHSHHTISRWNFDGSSAGSDITGGVAQNIGTMVVVGSEVWVIYYHVLTVERYDFAGALIASFSVNGRGNNYGVAVVGSQVWFSNWNTDAANVYQQSTISRFNFDTTSAGADLTGNGMNAPRSIAVVENELWAANGGTSISRINPDGSSGGDPVLLNLANVHSVGVGIAVVGSEVWVSRTGGNAVSRFNSSDGSSAGADLTGNSLSSPQGIAVVGSEIWVVNNGSTNVSRFLSDGSVAGSPYTGIADQFGIAVVGTKVWITQRRSSGPVIKRLTTTGGSGGANLSGNGMNFPSGIAVVGSEVWVVNYGDDKIVRWTTSGSSAGSAYSGNGLDLPIGIAVIGSIAYVTNTSSGSVYTVSQFNASDGSSAGSVIGDNGLSVPDGIADVGGVLWVLNTAGNSVSRFNFDGTIPGGPIYNNGLANPYVVLEVPQTKVLPFPIYPALGLVTNPGFEDSPDMVGWTTGGVLPPIVSTAQAHSGTKSCILGNAPLDPTEANGDSSIYQTVSIPGGLTAARLYFWVYLNTVDDISFDWQEVRIQDGGGSLLHQVFKICVEAESWTPVSFDMAAYIGSTVRIYFNVHGDGSGDNTGMYLDDVFIGGI